MGASVGGGEGPGGGRRRGGRRRRGGGGGGGAPMAEINVTPFVDVMLVLLIVFMLAANLIAVGVPLELPKSDAETLPTPTKDPVVVSINAEGAVFLGEDPIAAAELPDRLRTQGLDPEKDVIYIRGDTVAQHGQIMIVMGVLNKAGYRKFGLVSSSETATRDTSSK
ncbi:MAG: ExbD/TolR family protein [Neomegalonema sp.]|nr:ExbD/TolR family protein [Neomegalonema sp.]